MPLDRNPAETAFLRRLEHQHRDRPPVRRTPGIRATLDPLHLGRRPTTPAPPNPIPPAPPKETAVSMPVAVIGRSIKVVVPLDPQSVLAVECPESGPSRTHLTIRVGEQTLRAEVASKAVRKAQGALRQADAFAMLLGKLVGARIEECGLVAQVKAPKPEPAPAEAAA
jgi:hypothetical protein